MVELSPKERETKGLQLYELIKGDIRDRSRMMRKREYIRAIFYGERERDYKPWPGASDIHLPVMAEKIEGTVPKLVNAFLGAEPLVHVQRAAEEFNSEVTRQNEAFLNWALDADIPGIYTQIENWFRNMLLDGTSVLYTWWDFKERKSVEVHKPKVAWWPGEFDLLGQPVEIARPKLPLEILGEIFGMEDLRRGLQKVERADGSALEEDAEGQMQEGLVGQAFKISFVEDRRIYEDVLVEFKASQLVDEIEVWVHRPIIVCNNPKVEVLEIEDIIVPFRATCLQSTERVAIQYWKTFPEIEAMVEAGEWDLSEDDLEKLRASVLGDKTGEDFENKILKEQKDDILGVHKTDGAKGELAHYVDNKVPVWQIFCRDDLNGDGEAEEVIYHIPQPLRKIVKADYLETVFAHGRRPFAEAHYRRVSDRWYSIGMGEDLAPINIEVNAIVNQVNDAQELLNNPFFFYAPSALTTDPGVLESIEPGQGVPVADPSGIVFPKFANAPLANLGAVDTLLLFADRLSISPQAVGSQPVRNAPRTARGTLALLAEGSIKTDVLIIALQKEGWKELIHQIHALYANYGPDEKWFYVTGEAQPRRITPKEMRGRFEYRFSGNSVNTNREVMRTISQVRYTTLAQDPLYGMDMNARRNLVEDFAHHFSEGTDVTKILPRLPGQGGTHPPMDQAEENKVLGQGIWVDVLPTDNHAEHLQKLQAFSNSKEFAMLPESAVALIAAHMNQHMQGLQQQMQQATLPGGVQPGTQGPQDAPLGITQDAQTASDLNALEGGIQ